MKIFSILGLLILWTAVQADEPPVVVASIKPLALVAQALLKDTGIQTQTLLPPSISEHGYALKISDMKRLGNARLVIWIDEDMEPYLASTKSQWLPAGAPEKSLTLLEPGGHQRGHADPHIWLDPDLARKMAVQMTTRLVRIFPQEKNRIEKNRIAFDEEVLRLDASLTTALSPYKSSPFLVFHDAYSHWIEHYHLNQVGVILDASGSIRGLGRQAELQKAVDQQDLAVCLFTEPQLAGKSSPAFHSPLKIKRGILDPLGIEAHSYSELMSVLSEQAIACFKA